jgi:hypothetical protein
MDDETATNVIENENIKRVLGNVIGDMINYQIDKESIPEVSKEDIESILKTINYYTKSYVNEEYIAYLYNVTKNKDWGTQEIHTQGLNINF